MYIVDSLNILDEIRIKDGLDGLKRYFNRLSQTKPEEAVNLLNKENLRFTSLFVLQPEIEKSNLFQNLNSRNKIALEITEEILTRQKNFAVIEYISSEYSQIAYSVLKWMFETGFADDGLNNQFDEVLDITAILLTKIYREASILPVIVDLIFKRYKNKLYIHDLVWAFFEIRNPNTLILIANHLLSTEIKNIQLASNLLHFIPTIKDNKNTDKYKQYSSFVDWLDENCSFLYFTGQSLQQTNKPIPYAIILEAKYLCKSVSVDTGKILKPLTDKELKLLEQFKQLDEKTKILLSSFSSKMYHKSKAKWNSWIQSSLTEQIKIAKAGMGEYND